MTDGREGGNPGYVKVPAERGRRSTEEIQIIIYAQHQCEDARPVTIQQESAMMRTLDVTAEEEESPDGGEQDDATEILFQIFDFSCPHKSCDFRSVKKSAVVLHIKAKHGQSEKGAVRKCPYCDHITAHVSNLRTHILARHSRQKPWLCDQCGKKFADKSYYNAHLKRHRNDLRYPCSSCEVRFLLPSHLRAHMESRHSKIKLSYDPQFSSQLDGSECNLGLGAVDCDTFPSAEDPRSEKTSLENHPLPVPDHDYSRCAAPQKQEGLREVFECLECSSFFASIESLRVHSIAEHRGNVFVDREPHPPT